MRSLVLDLLGLDRLDSFHARTFRFPAKSTAIRHRCIRQGAVIRHLVHCSSVSNISLLTKSCSICILLTMASNGGTGEEGIESTPFRALLEGSLAVASQDQPDDDAITRLMEKYSTEGANLDDDGRSKMLENMMSVVEESFKGEVANPLTTHKCPSSTQLIKTFKYFFRGLNSTTKAGVMLKYVAAQVEQTKLPGGQDLAAKRDGLLRCLEMILAELGQGQAIWCEHLTEAIGDFLEEDEVKDFFDQNSNLPELQAARDCIVAVQRKLSIDKPEHVASVEGVLIPETHLCAPSTDEVGDLAEQGDGHQHDAESGTAALVEAIAQIRQVHEEALSSHSGLANSVEKILLLASMGLVLYSMVRAQRTLENAAASVANAAASVCASASVPVDDVDGPVAIAAPLAMDVSIVAVPTMILQHVIRLKGVVRTLLRFLPRP